MPRIPEYRESILEEHYVALQREVEKYSDRPISTVLEHKIESIGDDIDKIEHRRQNFRASEDDQRLYSRYIAKLDTVQGHIEELERTLTYLELHDTHRQRFSERVCLADYICTEITEALNLEISCLPVVRDGYALLPLFGDEYHIVFIPRGEELLPQAPILAHEVAHPLLLRAQKSPSFTDRFGKLRRSIDDDGRKRDFYENWLQWYEELFCDVVGFFVFGPAYAFALLHHLFEQKPFRISRNVTPRDNALHPPDALRIRTTLDLVDEQLSPELREPLEPLRTEYERHLSRLSDSRPSYYDEWADDELVAGTVTTARNAAEYELEQLCTELRNGTDPNEADGMQYRLEANYYWYED
ncbi:hypothetical protein [Haloglomus halophilum]|uniref:hypothetical protein n=1 Tax=Haloglomus halophilum TaxID=2962672 RepID=UPI0020C9DF66|nr:hypothetical protein [Haloglomus halophilum]